MAEQGAPEGTLVVAEIQTAGKGQKRAPLDSQREAESGTAFCCVRVRTGACFHADPACGHGSAQIREQCNGPGMPDQMA